MDKKNFKFDVVIGNPPYQEELKGNNDNYSRPIYPNFMEESYKIADKVELITPARFLFNAGATPKKWNQKMLNDSHLKVLFYEQDSQKVFRGTDIKGGVVVTLRDIDEINNPILIFTPYKTLGNIAKKVIPKINKALDSIVYLQNKFNLKVLYKDHPEYKKIIGSKGKDKRFRNNIFEKIDIFTNKPVNDDDIKVAGVIKNKRCYRYIPLKYIDKNDNNLKDYKVLVPRSNGSGAIGEVLSTPLIGKPLIGKPLIGFTQTFLSFGKFDNPSEAENLLKYIKSKFARTMLSVLKVTQDNPKSIWKYVPLQNFTSNSDIDWSKSIHDIDKQLYEKYDLNEEEINFIESKVKEMD